MTDEELKALVAELAIAQKITDARMKCIDEKVQRIEIYLGDATHNQGDIAEEFVFTRTQDEIAEEFFFNSLIKNNHLGSIHFDDVVKNMEKHRGQLQEEYDLVMTNGDAVAIVEVKYKAHENDLDKLDRKMTNFKKLFPIYQHYKQYGAIATFHINDAAKQEALKRGYFVLQRSGDLVHTESSDELKVF